MKQIFAFFLFIQLKIQMQLAWEAHVQVELAQAAHRAKTSLRFMDKIIIRGGNRLNGKIPNSDAESRAILS